MVPSNENVTEEAMSTEELMAIKERLYYNSFQPYSAKQKKNSPFGKFL